MPYGVGAMTTRMATRNFPYGFPILLARIALLTGVTVASDSHMAYSQGHLITWHGPTMGTRYQVKLVLPENVEISKDDLARKVDATLREINGQMSTYLADSEVSRFNRAAADRWFDVSPETVHVVQQALKISQQSGGVYDITIGPLVRLWHFGHQGKKGSSPPTPPSAEAIENVRRHIGYQHLKVRAQPPGLRKTLARLEIDLSSIAKGYAVDRVAQLLDDRKLHDYMVEIGGEIRTGGTRDDGGPWQIGIERPDDIQRVVQRIVPLRNLAVATSGDYRIFFMDAGRRYSHLLDPRTGRPVSHCLASASVLATDCMEADALATTLLILGPEEGAAWAKQHRIAALLLFRRDGKIIQQATPHFDQLTTYHPPGGASEKGPPKKDATQNGPAQKSSTGLTLLLTAAIIAVSLIGMAAGVILSNRRLRGSCGGLAGLRDAQGRTLCDGCTDPAPDCQGQPNSNG
jgi:thiamine biosynthesis lipoprotein